MLEGLRQVLLLGKAEVISNSTYGDCVGEVIAAIGDCGGEGGSGS